MRIMLIMTGILFLLFRSAFPEEEAKMKNKQNEKTNTEVKLPEPDTKGMVPLETCIEKRRSERSFTEKDLSLKEVSQLLWSAQGITDETRGFRASPSAGALYPLELYVVKSDGAFHYLPESHSMKRVSQKDLRPLLRRAALGQRWVEDAPVDIVICAVYERVTGKYGERGVRYTHLEAGHAAQNILLQSASMELGSTPVGAFRDGEVSGILDLPEDQEPLYIIPVGEPKK